MRASGMPAASIVDSVMASGLTGSDCRASANHAANRRKGSFASVKSPPVNHAGCSMDAASDILGVPKCGRGVIGKRAAGLYIVEQPRYAYADAGLRFRAS